jgi:hypothetical protein
MIYSLASRIALAMIWPLVTLIASTNAQTELHPTHHDPSDACTRVPDDDESTGAPGAHFLCFSFEPLPTTAAEAASPLPFTLSAQQTSSAIVSSTTIPQALNSTSNHDVSTTTLYTTLRGNDKATSTFAPQQLHSMTNGTLSSHATAKTSFPQNSTADSESSLLLTPLPKDGDGAANATMFPVVLQTVTYTTTICPSGD